MAGPPSLLTLWDARKRPICWARGHRWRTARVYDTDSGRVAVYWRCRRCRQTDPKTPEKDVIEGVDT